MTARLIQLWSRIAYRLTPLRLVAEPHTRQFSGGPTDAGIRWVGEVTLGGCSYEALLAHPDSLVAYSLPAGGAERFIARCAILPAVWDKHRGGVEFELTVRENASGVTSRASAIVDASTRAGRRWRTLRVAMPPSAQGSDQNGAREITVELRTRVRNPAAAAHAQAVWGEPQLGTRRPIRELAAAGMRAVSRFGWRGAFDRLLHYGTTPDQSARYPAWCKQHTPDDQGLTAMAAEVDRLKYRPLISIITPVWNTDPRWLKACVDSVRHQVYPHWELCLADDASQSEATRDTLRSMEADPRIKIIYLPQNGHISAASNAALKNASGEFVAMLDHDDELTRDALFEVVRHLNDRPDTDVIYSDEDKLDLDGRRCDPYFKPDWSPEHFLSCMYTCHLMVVRRRLMEDVGGFRIGYEGAQDYDLVLRLMERTSRIHHLPKILYRWRKLPESAASALDAKPWAHEAARRALADHLQRTGQQADVLAGAASGSFRIQYEIKGSPLVSIIIPTRGSSSAAAPLHACLQSLVKTRYSRFEVVVVSDCEEAPAWIHALSIAEGIRWQPHPQTGSFNFAEKINAGAAAARGEHLLLLNDDTEALHEEWLEAMLEHSQRDGVGAVGGKLLYPDGRLQHIGLILGVCGVAAHAFHQHPGSSFGYASSAVGVRNYSAISAACLMTRRSVFEEVGRFDPAFPIDFNDVDYCLRLRAAGYRIVFTPYARLRHREQDSTGPRQPRADQERLIRERWGQAIVRDPYYNPNLTTEYPDYRLGD